jgi:hypothetical protein
MHELSLCEKCVWVSILRKGLNFWADLKWNIIFSASKYKIQLLCMCKTLARFCTVCILTE